MAFAAPAAPHKQRAYRLGILTLFASVGVILAALAFEYIGGYKPCPLCLQQRWAYYAGIPLAFGALAVFSANHERAAALLFFVICLMFLYNSGLGVYHAGAEWKLWPGPDTCTGELQPLNRARGLLGNLGKTPVVRCDEAAWRMLGLSFAGWNVVLSLVIAIFSLKAAFASAASSK